MRFVTFKQEDREIPGILTSDGRQVVALAAVLRSDAARDLTSFIEKRSDEDLSALRHAEKEP